MQTSTHAITDGGIICGTIVITSSSPAPIPDLLSPECSTAPLQALVLLKKACRDQLLSHSLPSPTQSPTHLVTHPLIHPLSQSVSHPLTQALTHSVTHSLARQKTQDSQKTAIRKHVRKRGANTTSTTSPYASKHTHDASRSVVEFCETSQPTPRQNLDPWGTSTF